jgi:hypothetical protein
MLAYYNITPGVSQPPFENIFLASIREANHE